MKLRMSRIVMCRASIARSIRSLASAGVLVHQLGQVLQRQPDGVDALDDPVVEILGDPLAFLDDRQALDLLVQPRVLDGDPGVQGEHLDEDLIVL